MIDIYSNVQDSNWIVTVCFSANMGQDDLGDISMYTPYINKLKVNLCILLK